MQRIAIFGNAGGGKSTLARQLAGITGLPLYVIDMMQFDQDGAALPHDIYLQRHRDLLTSDSWIIDGYGDTATVWDRCAAADTLVHIDLPLAIHYWRVTKRLVKGLRAEPEGWPKGSPMWSSTMSSYRVLPRCHRYLTPKYRDLVTEMAAIKRVAHLRSQREVSAFLDSVRRELTGA
jgi:adenylate kinase family enzyme